MSEPQTATGERTHEVLGLLGFLLVATAQVSNMILARGVAGSVPPFSIAFFRWSIVALGLLPVVVMALREKPAALRGQWPGIALAGFLGMFICGGPVYVAGITTSAINLVADHGAVADRRAAVFLCHRPGNHYPAANHRHGGSTCRRALDHHQGTGRCRHGPVDRRSAGAARDAGLGRIHPDAKSRRPGRQLPGADRPVRGGRRAVLAAVRGP